MSQRHGSRTLRLWFALLAITFVRSATGQESEPTEFWRREILGPSGDLATRLANSDQIAVAASGNAYVMGRQGDERILLFSTSPENELRWSIASRLGTPGLYTPILAVSRDETLAVVSLTYADSSAAILVVWLDRFGVELARSLWRPPAPAGWPEPIAAAFAPDGALVLFAGFVDSSGLYRRSLQRYSPGFEIEWDRTLGESEGFDFSGATLFEVDAAGHVYLFDSSTQEVASYSPEGKRRWLAEVPGPKQGSLIFQAATIAATGDLVLVYERIIEGEWTSDAPESALTSASPPKDHFHEPPIVSAVWMVWLTRKGHIRGSTLEARSGSSLAPRDVGAADDGSIVVVGQSLGGWCFVAGYGADTQRIWFRPTIGPAALAEPRVALLPDGSGMILGWTPVDGGTLARIVRFDPSAKHPVEVWREPGQEYALGGIRGTPAANGGFLAVTTTFDGSDLDLSVLRFADAASAPAHSREPDAIADIELPPQGRGLLVDGDEVALVAATQLGPQVVRFDGSGNAVWRTPVPGVGSPLLLARDGPGHVALLFEAFDGESNPTHTIAQLDEHGELTLASIDSDVVTRLFAVDAAPTPDGAFVISGVAFDVESQVATREVRKVSLDGRTLWVHSQPLPDLIWGIDSSISVSDYGIAVTTRHLGDSELDDSFVEVLSHSGTENWTHSGDNAFARSRWTPSGTLFTLGSSIYSADVEVSRSSPTGTELWRSSYGLGNGRYEYPIALAVDGNADTFALVESDPVYSEGSITTVVAFSASGAIRWVFEDSDGPENLWLSSALVLGPDGALCTAGSKSVAGQADGRLQCLDGQGRPTWRFDFDSGGFDVPVALAPGPESSLWMAVNAAGSLKTIQLVRVARPASVSPSGAARHDR